MAVQLDIGNRHGLSTSRRHRHQSPEGSPRSWWNAETEDKPNIGRAQTSHVGSSTEEDLPQHDQLIRSGLDDRFQRHVGVERDESALVLHRQQEQVGAPDVVVAVQKARIDPRAAS